jgi:4a-hydroxytetrahydrobiopterin dehydratase
MPAFSERAANARMKTVPLWSMRGKSINRIFKFAGFNDAIAFVNDVAALAKAKDHHPDINIRWNKVRLKLSTHSEGGLTAKDFSMARQCSAAFERRST